MADIQGTNGDDIIHGGRGDDVINGLDGDDQIIDVWGNNTINGGGGDDRIHASEGADVVDGGSGSDRIWTRHGDDVAIYRLSENLGSEDYYDGGHGTDTLRLVLTAEEAQDASALATIAALRSFFEDSDPKSSGQPPTTFTFSIGGVDATLTLRNFENLEVVVEGTLPSLSIDDPTVTEGDPAGPDATITFTVTRTGDNGVASTVAYSVVPGTAGTTGDYSAIDALSGTLSFAAGETTKTITLDITDDLLAEPTESFTVNLSNPTNAVIHKAVGTGTIVDNGQTTLSINDPTVTEGDPGGTDATIAFAVTRSGDTSLGATVDYDVSPGSATFPGDYNDSVDALTGTLTFAPGETAKTITLDITDDLIAEPTETFTVTLSNPSNAVVVKAVGTGTVLDNDVAPQETCGYVWGDPHFVTLDGLSYDFQGVGEFTLVRSTADDGLVVQARTAPFRANVSVTTAVATMVDGFRVTIDTAQAQLLRIDGVPTAVDPSGGVLDLGTGSLTLSGNVYTITYPNQEMLVVRDFGNYINVEFCAIESRAQGTLEGLLGNFDGDPTNDFMLRDGTTFSPRISFSDLYGRFGSRAEGWRITDDESLFDYGPGQTTDTFTNLAFPSFATSLALLPPDLIREAEQLLDDCGVTDPTLRAAGILDYALSRDPSFIESVCLVEAPTRSAQVVDPMIVWTNGGTVVLGVAGTPVTFAVGTNAPVPAGVAWTGAAPSADWSDGGNWATSTPPGAADVAVFGLAGAGGVNVVDTDFQIAALRYSGAGDHVTDLNGGSTLRVSGDSGVHLADPSLRATLGIVNGTTVIAHLTEFNVGISATGSGSATGNLFLGDAAMLNASDVGMLSIGRETGAGSGQSTVANGSLTLASNSTLVVGSAAAPATLNIGWSQNANSSLGANGRATGVLDVLERAAVLDLHLSELNIGRGASRGFGTGTLKWDQSEVITAPSVTFGRGNATGILEVPAGGEFLLGTAAAPIVNLRIAYNDAGTATASAHLDFSQTNPTFTAFVAGDLSVGRETGAGLSQSTVANGSLTLASNSTLVLGSAAAPATLNIGWSQNTYSGGGALGNATGVLDAAEGSFTAQLGTVNVGVTANRGTANGQFIVGSGVTLDANIVNIGIGTNATGTVQFVDNFSGSFAATTVNFNQGTFSFGNNTLDIGGTGSIVAQTLNLRGGLLSGNDIDLNPGGAFNFTGGRLAVNTFDGTLAQDGGTLAPGNTGAATTTVNGNYNLASAGAVEVELNGAAIAGVDFDELLVNGVVNLNADVGTGGSLDVLLGFTPSVGSTFTIVENDGSDPIVGTFAGLSQLGTFDVVNGADTVTFQIDYSGGDGNDVDLEVTAVTTSAVTTAARLSAELLSPQPPLAASSNGLPVDLVATDDLFLFQESTADSVPPYAAALDTPVGPAIFDLAAEVEGIVPERLGLDSSGEGIDLGIVDNLDVCGAPSDGGLNDYLLM